MSTERARRRWWQAVDWRTVAVAGLPMWGLVAGVVVWQKCAPKTVAAAPVELTQTAPPPPVEVAMASEVLPPPRPAEEPVKKLDPAVAKALADGGKLVLQSLFAGKGEDDRPLVDLPAPDAVAKVKKVIPDGCKTYETAIHFVKNLETAQKKAKADGRLVFVLHLSGNIEDPGFT